MDGEERAGAVMSGEQRCEEGRADDGGEPV